jgi:hypothetical protein
MVEPLVMAAGQFPHSIRPSAGHKAIGHRPEPRPWSWQPRMGSAVQACGTMAGFAGVRARLVVLAVFPALDVTAKRFCPTVFDGLQGLPMAGQQRVWAVGPILGAVHAADRRDLDQHRSSMRRLMATQASS